ncbi:hypothetical protein OH76DRAFT_1070088 [Lentinus brumalis]|uniref:Uncharacterized protein n=1 Tax=Lentinus brumalis TaxID=2498619 RepID=A0A371DNU0_9APHY|nr:hypothetical protein OH76DRAFT_1070088 [Polyporus brumalis]
MRPSPDVCCPRTRPGDDRNAWEPASVPSSCQVSASASRTKMQMQRAKPPIQLSASGNTTRTVGATLIPRASRRYTVHGPPRGTRVASTYARPQSRRGGPSWHWWHRCGLPSRMCPVRTRAVPCDAHACRPTTPPPTRPRTGMGKQADRLGLPARCATGRAFPRFRRLLSGPSSQRQGLRVRSQCHRDMYVSFRESGTGTGPRPQPAPALMLLTACV